MIYFYFVADNIRSAAATYDSIYNNHLLLLLIPQLAGEKVQQLYYFVILFKAKEGKIATEATFREIISQHDCPSDQQLWQQKRVLLCDQASQQPWMDGSQGAS